MQVLPKSNKTRTHLVSEYESVEAEQQEGHNHKKRNVLYPRVLQDLRHGGCIPDGLHRDSLCHGDVDEAADADAVDRLCARALVVRILVPRAEAQSH